MSEPVQLVLWIAGVHLLGFICVAALMLPGLRDDPDPSSGRGDEGDGGSGRGPKDPPIRPQSPFGGIPLPDAVPAAVRLRDHRRLGDRRPSRVRRPAREPVRTPRRVTSR